MAGGARKTMPAQVCQSDEISNRIPSNYSRISIQNLRPHTNLHEKYAQATIQHRYQYNKDPVPSLKLILADDEGNTLDLIAFGQVADDLNICEQGDTLVCLKFEIEACPRHYHKLYQMIADDRESIGLGSDIWLKQQLKKKTSSDPDTYGQVVKNLANPRTPEKRAAVNSALNGNGTTKTSRKKLFTRPKRNLSVNLGKKKRSAMRKSARNLKHRVKMFYLRSDVSRTLPHKRYSTKHGPGYVMVMTIKVAHRLFQAETNESISLSWFAQHRPRNVRKLEEVPVEICLCVCCTNVRYKLNALRRVAKMDLQSETDVLDFVLCPKRGSQRWHKADCIHGQVMLIMDFAENRKALYHSEVKSAHFGKGQITLHPIVALGDEEDDLRRHALMFLSDDCTHDHHAVQHFTIISLQELRRITVVNSVVIWSDGCASQYKGKGTFADLSLTTEEIQRCYFGSEHGKGEADGETGVLSQAMARQQRSGRNFCHAKDVFEWAKQELEVSNGQKTRSFILVENGAINRDRPGTSVTTLPGTRSLHQVVRAANYVLKARKLACFCDGCQHGQTDLCINGEWVGPFDTFKLKPSQPVPEELNEAFVAEPSPTEEAEPEMQIPTDMASLRVGDYVAVTYSGRETQTYHGVIIKNNSSTSKSAVESQAQKASRPSKSFQQTSGTSISVAVSPTQQKSRTSKSVVVSSPQSTSKSVPESPTQQKSRTSKSVVVSSLQSTSKSVPESPVQQKSRTSKSVVVSSPQSTSKSVPESPVQQKSRTSESTKSTSKVTESPAQQKSRTSKSVVVLSPQSTSKSVPESPIKQKSRTSKSATALPSNQTCSTSASTAVPPPQHTSTTSVSATVSSSEHTSVKKTPSKQGSYTYRPLSEVKLNTIVDVYGVVKFFKGPIKTRGTDYCCNVSLTDPSLSDYEEKFSCNLFNRDVDKLPKLQIGDVVRFHRLKIQSYHGRNQGYNGPGFQWVVYRGSVENRQASTTSYTFEQQDKEKAASLLKWWTHERGADSSSAVRKTLSQVQAKEYFDLTCQVVRTCVLEPNVCRVFRVWDGTEYEGCVRRLTDEELDITTTEDLTLMKASADLAVDVFMFDNHAVSTSNIKPGDYVQFTNLHAAVVSGQTEMTLHGGTWFKRSVMVLPIDSSLVEDLKKVLDRLVEKCTSCAGLSREWIDNDGNEREEDKPSKKKHKSPLKNVGGTRKRLHDESDGSADDDDEKKSRSSGINERLEANVDEHESNDDGFRQSKDKGKAPLNPRGKYWRKKKKCDEETDDFCKKKARTQIEPSSELTSTGENVPSRADTSMTTSRIGREKVKSLGKNNSNKNITTCETRENSSLISGLGSSALTASRTNAEKPKMYGLSTTSTHDRETGKHSGISTKRNNNFDDSADTSSDSFHSIWVSAYGDSDYDQEVQAQVQGRDDMVIEEHDENIQDENVTSSGGSTTPFSPTNISLNVSTPDANWAHCDITSTSVNEETTQNDSDGLYLGLPIPTHTDSVGLDQRLTNSTQDHSDGLCQDQATTSPADSQDSYHTALSSDKACDQNKGHSSTPHSPPSIPSYSTQKIFLSLKGRHTETRATSKAEPQQNFLEISDEDFSALESSILCFETVQFSETSPHVHATSIHVGETERENATEKDISSACVRQRSVADSVSGCINLPGHSSPAGEIIVIDGSEDSVTSSTSREDGSQEKVEVPTCLLRTATVMKHPHAAVSSLKSILSNKVPFKFRTLVKVQDFQPRPTTARDLIYFHCAQCQHFESGRSLDMSSDSINDRLCRRCTTEEQPVKRRAVIILKFLLTDNNRCLMAHLWDKHAVKFFNGREPEELLSNEESFRQVQQCLGDLCPAGVDIKDRPWLDCCVFNYSLGQEVKYQIFDTVLVGLS